MKHEKLHKNIIMQITNGCVDFVIQNLILLYS